MNKKYKIAFVFIVEHGDLEQKGIILGESLRRFFPNEEKYPIYSVRPRKGEEIKQETLKKFRDLHIEYIYKPINVLWHNLPFANEAYGASIIEEKLKDDAEILVYLDADIVCLKYPEKLFLDENIKVAVTSIDVAGAGGVKYGEPLSEVWSFSYNLRHVDRSKLWPIPTKVDRIEIYPCFNSGLVAARPEAGIFRSWREMFEISVPHGYFSKFAPTSKEFFFTDQFFLATVIVSLVDRREILVLDDGYNFPLNLVREYFNKNGKVKFDEITFLHYHHSFYDMQWLSYFDLDDQSVPWLIKKLPILRDRKTAKYRRKMEYIKQYILHYYWKILLYGRLKQNYK